MFLLKCSSSSSRIIHSENVLSLDDSGCLKSVLISSDDHLRRAEYIELFEDKYHRDSLEYHSKQLFSICMNHFRLLSNSAKITRLPQLSSTQLNFYSDYAGLRKSMIVFFNYIKESLEEHLIHNESRSEVQPVAYLKSHLFSFRLLLGKMDNLPDFILQNYPTELGNECNLASFHLFHLYLELFWLLFVIGLQYRCIEKLQFHENLLETEDICTQDIFSDMNEKFDSEIVKEIEWFIFNLVSVSSKCYDLKGSKGIFSCQCVKDIWRSLINSINKLANENQCASFWEYLNNIVLKYVLCPEGNNLNEQNSVNLLYTMKKIKLNKPLEFSLGLLSKVVNLVDEQRDNNFSHENSQLNFIILETILQKVAKTDETFSENSMRDMMKQIIKISNTWTEPKSEIVMLLWEYFHKRMNSAFSIGGQDSHSSIQKNFFNLSINEVITDLNMYLSMIDVSKNSIKYENSFSLFLSLLGMQMKNSISLKQPGYCQKIKGRILPKFNLNKIVSLNEFGLKHFSFLFLILAKSSDINMCNKLQDLIVQLPFDNLPLNKKQIILKTHLIILHLYIENEKSVSKSALPLKAIMNKLVNLRDSESMNLVKITLNDYLEILNISSGFQNDEYVLIDSWISKYLTVCIISDLYNILDMFNNVLSKIQLICTYEINVNDSVMSMIDVFFEHVYTTVKFLFSNGSPALQIACLAFGFVKFISENENLLKKHGDFQSMLKYFINMEGTNNRVIRQFLSLLLQDDQILDFLRNKNRYCQILLINCWVKCSLLFFEEISDDDTHLMLLINQLDEFSILNITPGYGSAEQRNLCKFFYALGQFWTTLQNDFERKNFKDKVNSYLSNIDKEIGMFIKAPPSPQSTIQLFIELGTLFIHCSTIIYTRGDASCLLHRLINTILLPPQLFMGKKHHPNVVSGICRSWYMFMKGLYMLDCKSDMYVEKVMRDLIIQYLPYFTEKVFSKDIPFNVIYRIIPNEHSEELLLEKYILEKISSTFISCRGKQTHTHSALALHILHDLCFRSETSLVLTVISSTLLSVFEQLMFSDSSQPNKKISEQIVKVICNHTSQNPNVDIKNEIMDVLLKTCQKHLAFNSIVFFKLVISLSPLLGNQLVGSFLIKLKSEVLKIEKMRGVGFDQGLRKGIQEIEMNLQKNR